MGAVMANVAIKEAIAGPVGELRVRHRSAGVSGTSGVSTVSHQAPDARTSYLLRLFLFDSSNNYECILFLYNKC